MAPSAKPSVWNDADKFDPDRFLSREPGAFDPIPQGGGTTADTARSRYSDPADIVRANDAIDAKLDQRLELIHERDVVGSVAS